MSATQPVALYAAKVPADGMLVPAVPGAAAMFRVTMAAIDPDAAPVFGKDANSSKAARATLKIIRPPPDLDIDGDLGEGSDDEDEDSSDEDSSDDESNGGPSDPAKLKKAKQAAALQALEDDDEDDDDDDDDEDGDGSLKAAISKLIKGKDKALDDEGSESSDGQELDEVVVCTMDPEKNYQQPLDFVIAKGERVFFQVNGTHTVYLTGNYVTPLDDGDQTDESDDEDGEYDLSPDEDELDLMDEDDESDSLDDVENPRITEVGSDEEKEPSAKASKKGAKGKNKRPADDSDEEMSLDNIMGKAMKQPDQPTTNGEQKLSKKQQKKLKKNDGEAAEVKAAGAAKETERKPTKESPASKTDKKVQFAKELEQGPTGSTQQQKDGTTGTLGVKEVQGVKIDDKKLGKGRQAKQGDRVAMRYIGKLDDGKVFDANKKGKPFSFKVGSGEVIKGWDIGIPGMSAGGERRIVVPAHHAYGKKQLPGIPANSKLTFDIKLLEIK